ncbi:MAG: PEP-CTERM sorting domain-containing protein [Planctomycetota bacterium]
MKTRTLLAVLAATSVIACGVNASTVLLFEDWEYTKTSTDINTDSSLHSSIGYGLNTNNPNTTLNSGVGTGGNVLLDQGGFGGTYGIGDNAGSAIRVRSSNGAWLNRDALDLTPFTEVTFSFDLKQNTSNYVQVVEYSSDQEFTAPVLLDTFDGLSNVGVWTEQSYTLVDGVGGVTFTDDAYFRLRKLRPSPGGTNGGSNPTSNTYDNISITGVPEPGSLALLGLGGLLIASRRRRG